MSGIFGGGGGTVQTQQQSSPWGPVQPYLQDVFSRAQGLSNMPAQSPFTVQAQQMAAQRAMDPNSLTGQAQRTVGNTISGQYLNPSTNPYLSGAVNDALGQVQSKFAGLYGGAAGANVNNTGYQEGLARTLANTALPYYSNAYQQERQNQLGASQMAPGLDYTQSQALGAVGAQQQAAPWTQLQNYQGAISGVPGGQVTQQTPYYTNPFANALGLGLGASSLYNSGMFGGLGNMFTGGGYSPTAAFGGMGAGGALGMTGATLGGTDFASMLASGLLAL